MTDPEALLADADASIPPAALRLFACACCRRVAHLLADPLPLRLIELAERRLAGMADGAEVAALGEESSALYDSLYPGYGSASAQTLALAAAGEAAFTVDPLTAARNASSTAAMAVAKAAAEPVDDSRYDAVHDATYAAERAAQVELLRQHCLTQMRF